MEILDVVDETGAPTGETVERGIVHHMSGLPATGTDGFSFCCRRDVCRKIHFRAAMIFPVPDIYRQGRSIFLQQFGS
mgnify:CR=1 FL=1